MHTISYRTIRILHLSSEKSWRGGEQQIAYLIQELNNKGVENLVACRNQSAFEDYSHQNHWKFFTLPFQGSFDFSTIWGIKSICKETNIDLIHVHSAKSHSLAVMSHLLGNTTPLILSRRVDFPVRKNFLTQWKYNHPAIKKIICVSEAIEHIVRSSVRHPDKCVTVHSGIDISRFKNSTSYLRITYQISDDVIMIGNTSALANHKDYFTFIDTAGMFHQYNLPARFFIIGDGPEKETIRRYILERGLQEYVIMTGFLKNIPEVLPELDIFLMTSETEGLGTSVLDAFACKVPVVATRAGGIPEMVIHEKTGLLADVKDAERLAVHLKRLIQDTALKKALIANAYQHLLHNFTKEKMAEKTLKVYQEVLKNKKPGL